MADIITPTTVFLALLGGVLPAVFWLWFWLKEDDAHPEPRDLILLSFVGGMIATGVAFFVEKFIASYDTLSNFSLIFLWASTEETLKFLAIYIIALRTKYFDEPIDAVLYLVTTALGFAAMENTMFLFNPLQQGNLVASLLLGDFRFIGASLLHVAASGVIGVTLGLSFYYAPTKKILWAGAGLLGAIALHTIFNFSIIKSEGAAVYQIFAVLWVFIIGILFVSERIKRMAPLGKENLVNTAQTKN